METVRSQFDSRARAFLYSVRSNIPKAITAGIASLPALPRVEAIALQIAHRCGAAAFLLALANLALVYLRHDFKWTLAAAFLAANAGFCAAMLAWAIARHRRSCPGEALAVMIFNAIFLALSLQLILLDRMDLIRTIADDFFSVK
jgi:hypothetical protein